MDIISVAHRDDVWKQMMAMLSNVAIFHDDINFIPMDNRPENRGFSRACNMGAKLGDAPIIGLLNPDVEIDGPFKHQVERALVGEVVITGERFGKAQWELDHWGCRDWVCGAAFFVRRDFWERVGGFDERYEWSHEETDMIRRAQAMGYRVQSIPLPIRHPPAEHVPPVDADYKARHFAAAARVFRDTWGPHGAR